MYSAYDDRRRSGRDMPPSSSARYYDTVYAQPSSRSAAAAAPRYADSDDRAEPSYDRHAHHGRRKSVDESAAKASRRTPKVVASDDGWGSSAREPAYQPGRSSRHDVETKNGEGHRRFREKRGGYEEDEALNLRRAKSHSPRRAAREAAEEVRRTSPQAPPKSSWSPAADDYAAASTGAGAAGAGLRRSATTGRKARTEQYYDEDPRLARGATKPRERGYDYGSAAPSIPRPPVGEHYRTSPPSSTARDARSRDPRPDKPYHSTGAGAAPSAYTSPYEPPHAPEPPRRGRHGGRSAAAGDDPYSSAAQHSTARARHRADDYDDDPYGRAAPGATSRARPQRQSMPPQARSRYADEYEPDPAYAAPRRRATSMSQGGGPGLSGRSAYDGAARPRDYYDERPTRSSTMPATAGGREGRTGGSPGATAASAGYATGGAGGSGKGKDKGKKIGKQAGKLFMTHAFPVIKQEAVPFLTKAAQAYFEQKR